MRQVDCFWLELEYGRVVGMLLVVLDWLITRIPLRLHFLKCHLPITTLLLIMLTILVLLLLRCIILLWQVCLLASLIEVRFRVVVTVTESDIRSVSGWGDDLLTCDNAPTGISKRVHLMHHHVLPLRFDLLSHICYLLLQLINIVFFLCEDLPNEIWLRTDMLAHRPAILVCVDRGDNTIRLRSIILLVRREHRQKLGGFCMLHFVVMHAFFFALKLLLEVLFFLYYSVEVHGTLIMRLPPLLNLHFIPLSHLHQLILQTMACQFSLRKIVYFDRPRFNIGHFVPLIL